jgi:ferredoxin
MTYVVTDKCINCIYTDCVEVCPVDCFFEGENMLVIDPEICIDCGVCVPECPADAIIPDTDPNTEDWVAFNQKYAKIWPNILTKKPHRPDAEKWQEMDNKMKFFSPKPGDTKTT